MRKEHLREIVHAALLAPTPDNSQHWWYKFDGNKIKIDYDPKRGRHYLNRNNHASLISLGCVLESIEIAAKEKGYSIKLYLNKKALFKNPSAIVQFKKSRIKKDPLHSAIKIRATDRRPYKKQPLPPSLPEKLFGDLKPYSNLGFHFITDLSYEFNQYISQCECFIFEQKEAHDDIFHWVRFSKKQIQKTRDGMPWKTLGINFFEMVNLWLGQMFLIQKIMNNFLFLIIYKLKTKLRLNTSSGFGLITIAEHNPKHMIDAGRVWFRHWCRLNAIGWGFQPLSSASLQQYDEISRMAQKNVLKKYQILHKEGHSLMKRTLKLKRSERPFLLYRTGPSKPLPRTHRSLRRPLSDVFNY